MDRTFVMRVVLLIGAIYNFGAALMLALPNSLGQLAGLPAPGSLFYAWIFALFVAIFGGVYLWLAFQALIERPLAVVAIARPHLFHPANSRRWPSSSVRLSA